jgi:hypothetical protein
VVWFVLFFRTVDGQLEPRTTNHGQELDCSTDMKTRSSQRILTERQAGHVKVETPKRRQSKRKTAAPVAKKTARRRSPPPQLSEEEDQEERHEFEQIVEDAYDAPDDTRYVLLVECLTSFREPPPRKKRKTPRIRTTLAELIEEMDVLLEKANGTMGGLAALHDRIRADISRPHGRKEHERDNDEYVPHLVKDVKVRKKARPWSQEEEDFLIDLICTRGTEWSKFEVEFGRTKLYGRNQVAMKDKARNIMRAIINEGMEEEWVSEYENWKNVSVGSARRGVHAYQDDEIPKR